MGQECFSARSSQQRGCGFDAITGMSAPATERKDLSNPSTGLLSRNTMLLKTVQGGLRILQSARSGLLPRFPARARSWRKSVNASLPPPGGDSGKSTSLASLTGHTSSTSKIADLMATWSSLFAQSLPASSSCFVTAKQYQRSEKESGTAVCCYLQPSPVPTRQASA